MNRLAPQTVVTEVYEDLRPVVFSVADRFSRRYNLDRDDTRAAANLYFLAAYHSLDRTRGGLEQRVKYHVRNCLMHAYRLSLRRNAKLPRSDDDVGAVAVTRDAPRFSLTEFARDRGLTDDALFVVWLLTNDAPPSLDAAIRGERRPSPAKIRNCLRRYLVDNLKWATEQVLDAFKEIGDALS